MLETCLFLVVLVAIVWLDDYYSNRQ